MLHASFHDRFNHHFVRGFDHRKIDFAQNIVMMDKRHDADFLAMNCTNDHE
jgi:hypothetical protein